MDTNAQCPVPNERSCNFAAALYLHSKSQPTLSMDKLKTHFWNLPKDHQDKLVLKFRLESKFWCQWPIAEALFFKVCDSTTVYHLDQIFYDLKQELLHCWKSTPTYISKVCNFCTTTLPLTADALQCRKCNIALYCTYRCGKADLQHHSQLCPPYSESKFRDAKGDIFIKEMVTSTFVFTHRGTCCDTQPPISTKPTAIVR